MTNGLTFQMSRCGRHVVERTKGGGVVKPVPDPPAVFCRLKLWPAAHSPCVLRSLQPSRGCPRGLCLECVVGSPSAPQCH